jgi:hypothetical protein
MIQIRKALLVLGMALLTAAPTWAVPPPPPPPHASALADKLIKALSSDDLPTYASLLEDNVTVFDNGDQVASSRTQWMERMAKETKYASVSILTQAVSYKQILLVETVNTIGKTMIASRAQPGTTVVDCCFWARASSYEITPEGKVRSIRLLTSSSFWGTPEHPITGRLQPSN